MIWFQFLVSAFLIVIAGTRLVKFADVLSDKLSLSKAWIGVILLGLVTSLPEAITSLTAVISFQATDLAVGNMLGSNVYNLMIIVLLDVVYRQDSVTNRIKANLSNLLPALFAILLSIIVAAEIFLGTRMPLPSVGYVSFGTLGVAILYIFGIKILSQARELRLSSSSTEKTREIRLPQVFLNLALSAFLVVVGGIFLTSACEAIAHLTGLGRTFVGSAILALATSLPEIVVCLAAVKIGSFDMAIGNIFGSNMINIFIIFLSGLFYSREPILQSVAQAHILTVILGITLCAIIVMGIYQKKKKMFLGMGLDSLLMVICFLWGMGLLYQVR